MASVQPMVPLRSARTLLVTPGIDQRLRADDRAGAAGAIDDDGGLGVRRGAAGAQHQFGAGHADRAGNVHGGVFVEPPDIEDLHIGFAGDQASDLFRAQRRRMPAMLDQFAKRLGVGIDVLEQFIAGRLPALQPAVERTDIGKARLLEMIRRQRHQSLAGIVDHDRHILARQPRLGLQRDPVGRHIGGKQRMAGREGGLVPHIEQRDLLARQEREADIRGGDGGDSHEGPMR